MSKLAPRRTPASTLLSALFLAVVVLSAGSTVEADTPAFDPSQLADGGYVVMYRHATAPGTGDPPNFALDDCSTQRNLSPAGRDQAKAIGDTLRAAGIRTARVLTSRWCRARDTAELLGFGEPEPYPPLDSFFRRSGLREPATDATRDFITGLPAEGPLVILVTHQVNITALTDVFPASGEGIVLTGRGGRAVSVAGRLPPP